MSVTYVAVDVPAGLGSGNSIEFYADVDGRRVTNRMAREQVEFLEGDIRVPGRRRAERDWWRQRVSTRPRPLCGPLVPRLL
jgi:hypothetical protein